MDRCSSCEGKKKNSKHKIENTPKGNIDGFKTIKRNNKVKTWGIFVSESTRIAKFELIILKEREEGIVD